MKAKRFFVLLLLGLFTLPYFLLMWKTAQTMTQPAPTVYAISSPYAQEHRYEEFLRNGMEARILVDIIRDVDREINVSLYPYSHFNAFCELPMSIEGAGYYRIGTGGKVGYEFYLSENYFHITSIEFLANQAYRRLLEEDGILYEQRINGSWPFNGKTVICELPSEVGFYDPISISGLHGCGIVLFSSEDPGLESDIQVYVPAKKGWTLAKFVTPDGIETEQIRGYVRRQEEPSDRHLTSSLIGTMELCMANQEGQYELYQVAYLDDTLVLTVNSDISVTDDDLLNWAY